MSGKDHDQLDDAEFAAFLQGDDALARDLAALEQPAPPPALDAAIQARIAAALAAERLAAQPAANDPVVDTAASGGAAPTVLSRKSRWQSRWQLPLALAAGVAAISVALPLWQTHDPVTEAMVAAAPAQPAAPPPPAAPTVPAASTAPAVATPSAEPRQEPVPAKAAKREQAAPVAKKASEPRDAVVAEDVGLPPIFIPEPAPVTPRPPALMFAPPPAPAPAAPPMPAPAPVVAPATAPAPPAPPAPAPAGYAPGTVIANATNVRPESLRRAPQTVSVTGSRIMAPGEAQGEIPPQAWLQKIEELLKQNESGAALAEWRKFRAAYPAYPVPDKLSSNFPPAAE
ncbi:hypothetical protein [Pseudoduganella aquatica]|uniref:hypothetical protein n=1 Tax=Pseudoduganella aquatica TaxID=2660641 RepID=UPI001E503EC7|nr:hypothetical protein [Pseudoduganella aquatica]